MNISRCDKTNQVVFELTDRLDTMNSIVLQNSIITEYENGSHVVLDLKQLAYISSMGLRAMLQGEKVARAKELKQTLVNVSDNVMEVLRITGLSKIFTVL